MNKDKLKQIRSLMFEIEEEKERQYTLGAWSLFHDDNDIIKRNKKEIHRIYEWIEDIPDCLVRRAIKLRYIDGRNWTDISVKMGYTSPDGARKLVSRYFEKNCV